MAIKWREAMSIDGGFINDDHKFLISLINEFEDLLSEQFNQSELIKSLEKLEYYTVYHFAREESLQREIKWPDIEEHIEKHKKLVEYVKNALALVKNIVTDDKVDRIQDNILRLLKIWIIGHIMKHDIPMKFAARAHTVGRKYTPITSI